MQKQLSSLFQGRYRWLVCGLLFAATTINYVDRQILSLIKPVLDEKFHWSNEQFGQINAAFQAAYSVGGLAFGWFIDRYGTGLGYGFSIAVWSCAAAAHAFVGSISGFLGVRVLLGFGEGGNFPSAIKTVALWFPKRERALATSLFNAGANVGALLAPALVPWVVVHWGWQAAFVVAGLCGLVWLIFWGLLYDIPKNHRALSAEEYDQIRQGEKESSKHSPSWYALLSRREVWAFVIAKFLTDPVWWFFLIWLPDFFKQARHLEIKNSWLHLVTIYGIVTVFSVLGGWLPGFLVNSGWSVTKARKACMLLFALFVVPILFAARVDNWTAVVLIGVAGAAHQAWSANLFTSVSDMFPKSSIATVIGLGSMAGSFGGILFPLYTGHMLDQYGARGDAASGYAVLFVWCSVAYLLAFALHHLLTPRFEPIHDLETNGESSAD